MNMDRFITKRYQSKTDQVVETLTELILTGNLENEAVLPPENDMCLKLGVSRSIFRESMKILAAKGLVEIRQGVGTVIKAPGEKVPAEALSNFIQLNQLSPFQVMEIRAPLEIEIAGLAAERRKQKHIETMREALQKMQDNSDNSEICIRADEEFHKAMVISTENILFTILMRSIGRFFNYLQQVTIQFGVEKVIVEHSKIFDAIQASDIQLARQVMKAHMDATVADLHKLGAKDNQRFNFGN